MLTKKALGLMIGALLSGALIGGEAAAGQALADFHSKLGGCASCHGTNAVTAASVPDDERALNAQCQTCHGSYKDIRKTGTEIDPHHSHLGDINCTSCHTAHARPKLVCNDCHTFPNKMPFADAPEAAPKVSPDEAAIEAAMKAEPRESYDVVVIGAGSAGFNAAIAARRAGASVLLLEKHSFSGGNSMLAAGGYNAVGTKQQKAKGINDTVEAYVEDTLKGGRGKNDRALVEILAKESAAGVEWLEGMGADLSEVKRSGGARVDRTHRPTGGETVGPHIVKTLRAQAEKDGVPARLNSRAVRLLVDENHTVRGVVVEGRHSGLYRVNAKAVVLAAGGYGQNKEMVAFYRPTFKGMTSSNNVTSTGDGVRMALEAGASMTDIDWIQAHPTVGKGSRILISETVRGVGAVMVNEMGARFVNEPRRNHEARLHRACGQPKDLGRLAQGCRRRASQRLFPGLQHRTDRLTAGREGHGQKRPSGRSEAAVFLELKCDPRASGSVSARRAGVPCASAGRSSTSRELRERRSNGRSRTRAACRSRSC